eukprot:TRINITY_DN12446_c0_g1_i1.p2 TRINITY_DN12446_c0_g1~~TRINITY_DN12446_c0_g1_i1.p2  ORF type:complete len:178 (-),score=35.61 TRINITY_DN12446_c0_g1_i1:225-758(-)
MCIRDRSCGCTTMFITTLSCTPTALSQGVRLCKRRSNQDIEGWATMGRRVSSTSRLAAHDSTTPFEGRSLEPVAVPFKGYTAMTGVMCGLAIGESLLSKVPLKYPASTPKAVARCTLGLSGLMGVFLGLGALEKKLARQSDSEVPPVSMQALRFVRYGSVPVVILLLAPMVFNKLRI